MVKFYNLFIMYPKKSILHLFCLTPLFWLTNCSIFSKKDKTTAQIIFSNSKNTKIKDNKLLIDKKLVRVPGGSYASGVKMANSLGQQASPIRKIQVSEFYIGATLTTNYEYRTYVETLRQGINKLQNKVDTQKNTTNNKPTDPSIKNTKNIKKSKKKDPKKIYEEALPNLTVWNSKFSSSYNDKGNRYFYAKQYNNYPVVGVSFLQAIEYCAWKTKLYQQEEEFFQDKKKNRTISKEEIATRKYTLPTEIEWEYATTANDMDVGMPKERTKRLYPWDGKSFVIDRGPNIGSYKANFKRGPGSYGEKGSYPTANVDKYPPNDFGIYIGGNLREWTCDIYRQDTLLDINDLNPSRKDGTLDPESNYDPKNSLISDKVRVIKGASWRDVPYYLQVSTRRYCKEDTSSADVGFRCVMHF